MSITTETNGATQHTEDLPTRQLPDKSSEQQKQESPVAVANSTVRQGDGVRPADLGALEELRQHAQRVVEIQDDPAIAGAKTDQDLADEAAQRQRHRADQRAEADVDHQADLRRRAARREREDKRESIREQHDDQITAAEQKRERQQAEAEAERKRLLDPTDQLRRAHQQRTWVPLALMIPTAAATITSMINLAVQGARVVSPPPTGALLGAGADLVFTAAMISLLIARFAGVDSLVTAAHGQQSRQRGLGWFAAGDLIAGAALVGLNIVAHSLPSADSSPHNPATGYLFAGLAAGFIFSSVFAPLARKLLDQKFRDAAIAAQQHELAARLDAPTEKLAHDMVVDVRTAKMLLEIDEQDGLGGIRGDDGLPSATKVYEAMKRHIGRGNHASAGRIRSLMREISASHFPA